jgi:hypothetical protein
MLNNPNFMRGPPVAVTPEQIKERNERIQQDSERMIAHYRERDRERQERELKEGREAIAREVAERNRRKGGRTDPATRGADTCPQSAKGDIRSFER